MLTLLFIFLASIANAVMDTLSHHFSRSVFRNMNPKWWYPNESWQYVRLYAGYRPDAWHLAKTGMLGFISLAVVYYEPIYGWWDILLIGAVWNITFEVVYSKVLLVK